MSKLSKRALEDICFSEIKNLLYEQKQKGITEFKEYLRELILNTLENISSQNRKKLTREDFFNIKQEIDNTIKNEYIEILKKYSEGFSYQLLEKFIKITNGSIEEFQRLCEKNDVKNVLKTGEYKNLEILLDLFEIETSKSFEDFCTYIFKEDLIRSKTENLKKIVGLCKNSEEFKKLYENKNVKNIIIYAKPENLEILWDLLKIKTLKDFEEFCKDENMVYILKNTDYENLKILLNFYKIKKLKDLKNLCQNNIVNFILENSLFLNEVKSTILRKIIGLCRDTTEFEELCKNGEVRVTLCNATDKGLKEVLERYEIENSEDFKRISQFAFANREIRYMLGPNFR